jgi:hypothetical protein
MLIVSSFGPGGRLLLIPASLLANTSARDFCESGRFKSDGLFDSDVA